MVRSSSLERIALMLVTLVLLYAGFLENNEAVQLVYVLGGMLCITGAAFLYYSVIEDRCHTVKDIESLGYKLHFITAALLLVGTLVITSIARVRNIFFYEPDNVLTIAAICGALMFVVIWILAALYVFFVAPIKEKIWKPKDVKYKADYSGQI